MTKQKHLTNLINLAKFSSHYESATNNTLPRPRPYHTNRQGGKITNQGISKENTHMEKHVLYIKLTGAGKIWYHKNTGKKSKNCF